MGVKRGDIIGLTGRNVPEWLIANFGVQMAGGCPLCLPYQEREDQITKLLNSVESVKMLIMDPGVEGRNCHISEYVVDKGNGKVECKSIPALENVILFYPNERMSSAYTVAELCSRHLDLELPRIDPEDVGFVSLSSGSSGLPKAIPSSHHALVVIAWHCYSLLLRQPGEDILYNDRPFSWVAGYPAWEMAACGTRVTLTNTLHSSSMVDAVKTATNLITKEKAIKAFLVPSMLELAMKRKIHLKIKKAVTSGVVVHASLLECIDKICDELQVLYGMTEMGYLGSRVFTSDDKARVQYMLLGVRPSPWVEVKITDDHGHLQPVGQRGNILIRSKTRFTGYLNHDLPPQTEDLLLKSGWFYPKDGGYVSENGLLFVEGRLQEMIQVFGRKMYPFEIENVINAKSNVIAAIVLPIKDMETGDHVPSAAIIYQPQNEDSMESMQDYLRKEFNITEENQLLECLYVPQVIVGFKTFPALANGKLDHEAIRKTMQRKLTKEQICRLSFQ
uniref:4-coumarate--CoA ligase 1 n=1 Tax=Magallana gigas TaxID=29159 RepID=K1QYW9_MAGGI